jgi:hypothetical protein
MQIKNRKRTVADKKRIVYSGKTKQGVHDERRV